MSGESKCGLRRSTSRRLSTQSLTILFGRHSKLAMSITSTSASRRKFTETRRLQYRQTKESEIFRYPKRIQARRSDVQPTVQHDTSVLIQGRNTTMTKEKRNGNLLQRPRLRLSHELTIYRRPEYDV